MLLSGILSAHPPFILRCQFEPRSALELSGHWNAMSSRCHMLAIVLRFGDFSTVLWPLLAFGPRPLPDALWLSMCLQLACHPLQAFSIGT